MDLQQLTERVLEFRDAREWVQFHSPRNLAAALAVEAGELQELMLWMSDEQAAGFASSKEGHARLSDEVADIFIYALLFADATGIDLAAATQIKLEKNAEKYPVDKARGSAAKYDAL